LHLISLSTSSFFLSKVEFGLLSVTLVTSQVRGTMYTHVSVTHGPLALGPGMPLPSGFGNDNKSKVLWWSLFCFREILINMFQSDLAEIF